MEISVDAAHIHRLFFLGDTIGDIVVSSPHSDWEQVSLNGIYIEEEKIKYIDVLAAIKDFPRRESLIEDINDWDPSEALKWKRQEYEILVNLNRV